MKALTEPFFDSINKEVKVKVALFYLILWPHGLVETVRDFIFLGSKITADGDCGHAIKRRFIFERKIYHQPRQNIKKQRHYFTNKGPSSQSYGFPSSHVWMGELDHKESRALKNWCFWTVLETLESFLDCKEIQSVHPKGNQSWIFIGRTDAEAEASIVWPPSAKNWLFRKDPEAGKNWKQEEKGTTEDKMVGWHHRINGHEFEQAPGVGDGQGSLGYCSPWGCKVVGTQLSNWTELAYNSPWNSPDQNTGVGSLGLVQCIFLTQESNWGLIHCRQILYLLSYQGIPIWQIFLCEIIFIKA